MAIFVLSFICIAFPVPISILIYRGFLSRFKPDSLLLCSLASSLLAPMYCFFYLEGIFQGDWFSKMPGAEWKEVYETASTGMLPIFACLSVQMILWHRSHLKSAMGCFGSIAVLICILTIPSFMRLTSDQPYDAFARIEGSFDLLICIFLIIVANASKDEDREKRNKKLDSQAISVVQKHNWKAARLLGVLMGIYLCLEMRHSHMDGITSMIAGLVSTAVGFGLLFPVYLVTLYGSLSYLDRMPPSQSKNSLFNAALILISCILIFFPLSKYYVDFGLIAGILILYDRNKGASGQLPQVPLEGV